MRPASYLTLLATIFFYACSSSGELKKAEAYQAYEKELKERYYAETKSLKEAGEYVQAVDVYVGLFCECIREIDPKNLYDPMEQHVGEAIERGYFDVEKSLAFFDEYPAMTLFAFAKNFGSILGDVAQHHEPIDKEKLTVALDRNRIEAKMKSTCPDVVDAYTRLYKMDVRTEAASKHFKFHGDIGITEEDARAAMKAKEILKALESED